MLHQNAHLRLIDAILRLDREHVVAPPGAACPVGHALPDVRVLLHVSQHVVERGQGSLILADADFAQKQTISSRLCPRRDVQQSLDANVCRHDVPRRAAAVLVEILMDLEREIVVRVLNARADDLCVIGPL